MIEFLAEPHLYLKDGIVLPSVTQILQMIFPEKYKGINKNILNKKANFGTMGHSIIEHLDVSNIERAKAMIMLMFEKKEISQDLCICLREYIRLVEKFNISPIKQEEIVSYRFLYCGTADMIAYVDNKYCLLDIKFTSECDEEYLSWQIGMYKLALDEEFDDYYCIWLRSRELAKLVHIVPKTKEEILSKLKELGLC